MTTLAKNARTIEALRTEGKRVAHTIKGEPGLRLVVHPTGRKVWFVVYHIGKSGERKRRWLEIGEYGDDWPLAKAAREARRIRDEPPAEAIPEAIPDAPPVTFGDLFQSWLAEHAKKKLATWQDEERRYQLHLRKPLGSKKIAQIERKDVREVRDTVLEEAGPIQSNRVVALFNRVMNWAVDEDRAKFNPAARLKKTGEEQRRERVLTPDELRRVWHELGLPLAVDHDKGGLTEADLTAAVAVRRALKLLIITGQRRGEVIGLCKDELDLADQHDAWWTIPSSRTKNGLPHRVPLTQLALGILSEAIEASHDSPFVFPSTATEGAIRPDAVTKQLQRMCRRMTPRIEGLGPHDIRRTVGTTMRKLGIPVEDRSYVLNHISGAKAKVTSWNYDAGEHDDEKRGALEKWELQLKSICGMSAGNVIPLRA